MFSFSKLSRSLEELGLLLDLIQGPNFIVNRNLVLIHISVCDRLPFPRRTTGKSFHGTAGNFPHGTAGDFPRRAVGNFSSWTKRILLQGASTSPPIISPGIIPCVSVPLT